ncbi:2-phospho-L-lactate transferase [uncultured archaeon]|nr:2-phospho-L-lactate transferase [uncultured archaeon]
MLVFSGGTGTPKLLLGLKELLLPEILSVVVNTAEDLWISGNYVSPDVDTVLYTLADLIDERRWWGIKGDRTLTHDFLLALGHQERLLLGDKDRAVHIFRSEWLRQGLGLYRATEALARSLGIKQKVVPMSDDPVSTFITTREKKMHFQDFWVGLKGRPDILSITFEGIDSANPCQSFLDLLEQEDTILLGPSNPVTSIGPILALPGVRARLREKKVVAVSPLVGDRPVSGPAAKLMSACNVPVSDEGVRSLLGKVDLFVVDKTSSYQGECVRLDTLMRSKKDSLELAKSLLELIKCS